MMFLECLDKLPDRTSILELVFDARAHCLRKSKFLVPKLPVCIYKSKVQELLCSLAFNENALTFTFDSLGKK